MMAKDVSLMVLLTGTGDEALPQVLVNQSGVWRDTPSLLGGPAISLKRIQDNTEQRINEVMGQINNVQPSVWRGLMTICGALYNAVVPPDVQKVLDEAVKTADDNEVPSLHIHFLPRLEWIPWEIMWESSWERPGFLGLRFQIARLPIISTPPDLSDRQPHPVRRIHNVLAENVLALPPDILFEAWRTTFRNLIPDTVEECQLPKYNGAVGPWPTLEEVATAEVDDILHLTCHGGFRDQMGEVYWTLNHLKSLPWLHHINHDFVRTLKLAATKPLVFGNACSSGGTGNQGGLSPGLGTSFFARGALNFVGTFAPITKRLAIDFASQFYQRLLRDGLPIGKALWATKKHFFDLQENDPSFLFYCLYGPSETRFQVVQ